MLRRSCLWRREVDGSAGADRAERVCCGDNGAFQAKCFLMLSGETMEDYVSGRLGGGSIPAMRRVPAPLAGT